MKKFKAMPGIFAVFCALLLATVLSPEARAMTGTGTEADPYMISTAADLEKLHDDLTAHYALGADLNMGGLTWKPVGNGLDGPFTGSLDGRGHTLSNLYLDMSGNKYTGLFGYLEGSVKGVKLDNVLITGGRYTGGIAGNAGVGSSITDCHVLTGAIKAANASIDCSMGGIAGLCEGNITDCSNGARLSTENGSISVSISIGGIAGTCSFSPVEIKGCTNTGNIFQGQRYDNANATTTTSVYAGPSSLGGIAGRTTHPIIMENCKNEGSIKASASTYRDTSKAPNSSYRQGGMIGSSEAVVRISRCVNGADSIYATSYLYTSSGYSSGNYNLGYSGGIVGYLNASGESSIAQCENRGSVGYTPTGSGSGSAAIVCHITGGGRIKIESCENWGTPSDATSIGSMDATLADYKSAITSVGITSNLQFLLRGQKVAISNGIQPSNIPLLESIVWTSSDESVATVDQNGVVSAHDWGNATITATTSELGKRFSASIRVAPTMAFETPDLYLEYEHSAQLKIVREPEYEDTYNWYSDSSYITVDSNGVVTSKERSLNILAKITATSVKSGRSATCQVHVVSYSPSPAKSVKLNQTVLRPVPGERILLSATVTPSNAIDTSVTWESSNPEVASVTKYGTVEAIAPGEATITVRTANGLYDTCQVKVLQLSSAAFVIPDSRGSVNGAFDTAVHLVKNPGIAAFTLEMSYDATALTPVAVTPCDLLASGTLTSSAGEGTDGKLRITWYSTADAVGDGPAITVTWQAKSKTGTFPVSLQYDQEDICNAEKVEVTVSKENGSIRVLDRPVGDIYHDELVNMKDIVYFARYFNKLETLDSNQFLAADLFYDGAVDVKDLTQLAQVLSEDLPAGQSASLLEAEGEGLAFTVSDAILEHGTDTAVVTVFGSGQSAALRFRVAAPEGMRIFSVQPAGVLEKSDTFTYNAEMGIVTWYSETDQALNGELFTITLEVTDTAQLPAQVELEYAEGDFFTAGTYANVPVSVQGGMISQLPYTVIEAANARGQQVAVTIETNRTQPALLIAAFYQDGKMVSATTAEVKAAGEYRLDIPAGVAWEQCKVFLLDSENKAPLSPAIEAARD